MRRDKRLAACAVTMVERSRRSRPRSGFHRAASVDGSEASTSALLSSRCSVTRIRSSTDSGAGRRVRVRTLASGDLPRRLMDARWPRSVIRCTTPAACCIGLKARATGTRSSSRTRTRTCSNSSRASSAVTDDRIALTVNVHLGNGLTLDEIESWWLRRLALPRSSLRQAAVNRVSRASQRKRRTLPYGTVRLAVCSTFVLQSIYGAIQAYAGIDRPAWLD